MAITKYPARLLTIEISEAGSGGNDWVEVKGLNSLTHSPSTNKADTTDFDSDGRAEHMIMERGDEWTLTGRHLMDVVSGTRDPGQELVEALGIQTGIDSTSQFRITWPDGTQDTFAASAEVTRPGGGHNDPATWSAKVTVSGAYVTA